MRGRTLELPITNCPVPMLRMGTFSMESAKIRVLVESVSASRRGTVTVCSQLLIFPPTTSLQTTTRRYVPGFKGMDFWPIDLRCAQSVRYCLDRKSVVYG